MASMKAQSVERGFTLIELVVAVAFMGIIIVAVSDLFIGLRQINTTANNYQTAVEAAQQQMETYRNTPYSNIAKGTTDITTAALGSYTNLRSPRSATTTVSYINTDGTPSASDLGLKNVEVAISYTDRTGVKNVRFSTWIANKGINP
jgi:prepilin-type N-terminal cleavage/methylation domain-containing protein